MMLSDLIERWNALGERVYRRRWWIRAVAAVILLPWFGHFAYTRMATMPPLPRVDPYNWNLDFAINKPPPELDRTKDLAAAVQALPADPVISVLPTAPAGMQWVAWQDKDQPAQPTLRTAPPSFNVSVVLNGPWSPSTRLIQGEMVKYLELPATVSAMATITELADQPLWFTFSGGIGTGQVTLSEARRLARLYTTRSRYYLEEKKDFPQAVDDLRTVLQLAQNIEDDGVTISILVGAACRALVMNEIIFWSHEYSFDRHQAQALFDLLSAISYDLAEVYAQSIEGEYRFEQNRMDQYYTRDSSGNGWSVIKTGDLDYPSDWLPLTTNLLSPLFADRREIETVLAGGQEHFMHIPRQSYAQARARFDRPRINNSNMFGRNKVMNGRPTWNQYADAEQAWSIVFRSYVLCLNNWAFCKAAETAIALSVYRHEHNRYPHQLSELVPDYLTRLPLDPFTDEPLRYRLEAENGYVLYSVGENGIDDGGVEPDPNTNQDNDLLFPRKRSEPYTGSEYVLIPARSATQPNGGGVINEVRR